jgi:hypothetical protein
LDTLQRLRLQRPLLLGRLPGFHIDGGCLYGCALRAAVPAAEDRNDGGHGIPGFSNDFHFISHFQALTHLVCLDFTRIAHLKTHRETGRNPSENTPYNLLRCSVK